MSSLDDLGTAPKSDIANITKKIVRKIEDIGTDIYQASLPGRSITERE